MKVLITGGAGFIGSNISKLFLKNGHEVHVIDNLITGRKTNIEQFLPNKRFHFFEGDVCTFDFSTLSSFDTIYNLASPASPIQYKKFPVETLMTNALGTFKLLEFMKSGGSKKFILASTSEVYGDPLIHPQNESYFGNVNPVGSRACYDEAKRFAESLTITYFKKYNLDIRIARIFNTYGPNMEKNDGRVVSNFIMQALNGQPITIYGKGNQTRSFCYVDDMIEGLLLLGTTTDIAGEIINLGNPCEKTVLELAKIIKEMVRSGSDIVFESIDTDDPKKRKPDIGKAKKLLGWQPTTSLEKGLSQTIEYFKNQSR